MRGTTETTLVKEIQLALASKVRLFRNNVGEYKTDKYYIKYGLCVGSADLIGFVLDGTCRFVAIECKTETGRVSKEQQLFIDAVNLAGGIAFVCRSVKEARERFKI